MPAKRKTKGKKLGRPEFSPTEEQRLTVRNAKRMGLTDREIAELIYSKDGHTITRKTLAKHFKEELKEGRALPKFETFAAGYKVATDPDHKHFASMNQFMQRAHFGVDDTYHLRVGGEDGQSLAPAPMFQVIVQSDD